MINLNKKYFWQKEHKYYSIFLVKNLFGNIDIFCSWGSMLNNLGNYKIITCSSLEELHLTINSIKKRRKIRGYELIKL